MPQSDSYSRWRGYPFGAPSLINLGSVKGKWCGLRRLFHVSIRQWYRALTVWGTGRCSVFYSWLQWLRVTINDYYTFSEDRPYCHLPRDKKVCALRLKVSWVLLLLQVPLPNQRQKVLVEQKEWSKCQDIFLRLSVGLTRLVPLVGTRRGSLRCRSQRDDASKPCEIPL